MNLTSLLRLGGTNQTTTPSGIEKYIPQGAKEVNEEQLFIALVAKQLDQKKSGLGETFIKAVSEGVKNGSTNSKRTPQLEDVGQSVLMDLQKKGILSKNEHQSVLKTAWTTAQLDDNPALWDSKGSKNDPTVAKAETNQALQAIEKNLAAIQSGALKLIEPQSANSVDKNGMPSGFLWKPITENSGTAAVLFNADLAKQTKKVELVDGNGKNITTGRFTSFGEDGARGKYVFSKPGGDYPSNASIVITLNDGQKVTVAISDPAKRLERKQ